MIGKEMCNELLEKLKKCSSSWYSESFLKAQSKENTCKEEYENYKACIILLHHQKKEK